MKKLHYLCVTKANNMKTKQIQARETMTRNARNMFSFTAGQKVNWVNGSYDHYYIKTAWKDNGLKLYTLINPLGGESGGRVREDELYSC